MTVTIEPLTAEAFAPFGRVVSVVAGPSRVVNEGRGTRRDLPRPAAIHGAAVHPVAALYRLDPSAPPLGVAMVERHPASEQLFWPLDVGRWLVAVLPARPDGSPESGGARAFLAGPGQGVIYGAGIWHQPLVVLDRPGLLLMRMWESRTPLDCEELTLPERLRLSP